MLAFLEIARSAFLSMARRLGPLLAVAALLGALAWYADPLLGAWVFCLGEGALIGVVLPLLAGAGLRRWLRSGPLGLTAHGGYLATVGYGLGAGLVALPFALLTLALLEPRFGSSDAALLAMLILAAAWLGSAAGRMVQSKLGMFVLSVLGGVLVAAGTVGGTMGIEELVVGHHPVASGRLMFSFVLVFTHLLLLGVSLADRRSPAQVER